MASRGVSVERGKEVEVKGCLFGLVVVLVLAVSVGAYAQDWKMQKRVDNAAALIHEFIAMPESNIPPSVLENSKGLAILSVLKGGFVIGVRGGGGVVIAKDAAGNWTAPSAISMGGASIGFQIGAQQTDFILVLNTDSAVEAFSKSNCTLGGDASISAGPVGRTAEIDITVASAIFSYSRSKGLFAGVSIEGAIVNEDKDINNAFYGRPVTAKEILSGQVPRPDSASALYDALSQYVIPRAEPVVK